MCVVTIVWVTIVWVAIVCGDNCLSAIVWMTIVWVAIVFQPKFWIKHGTKNGI